MGIQTQGMVGNDKTFGQGHIVLSFFNFRVVELFNFAAIQANVGIVLQKVLENILRCHVPLSPLLKDFKYLLSRNGGLESGAFEFVHENWFANERQGLGEFGSPEPNATATMS